MLASYDVLDITVSVCAALLVGRVFISSDVMLRRVRGGYVSYVRDFRKSCFFPLISLIRFSFLSFYLVSSSLFPFFLFRVFSMASFLSLIPTSVEFVTLQEA